MIENATVNVPMIDDATHDSSHNENDTSSLDRSQLIARISELEASLKRQTEQLRALTQASASAPRAPPPASSSLTQGKPKKQPNVFDPSAHHTRHIALKLSYLGTHYNGFEHTNNVSSAPPLPTVEEVLWKALRKARLISPEISDGADNSYEVVWDTEERAKRYGRGLGGGEDGAGTRVRGGQKGMERLELNWEGCDWSKCGRTDRGVSAFGQVVGVRVRSTRPKERRKAVQSNGCQERAATQLGVQGPMLGSGTSNHESAQIQEETDTNTADPNKDTNEEEPTVPAWDSIRDELPYISILNGLLPPSIRILAWCPHLPPDWDARFGCKERRYKYFFTNPAFCPTPGPLGWKDCKGKDTIVREGWLDVEAMKTAAKKLEGLHDFRNFCKIDAGKQMSSCERRITFADVSEFDTGIGEFVQHPALDPRNRTDAATSTAHNAMYRNNGTHPNNLTPITSGPRLYVFAVHGTAFLWHQVRCMAAVLFLIGQGLEPPSLIDTLLDIQSTPGRPHYEMASDTPLVLWDCVFPGDDDDNISDRMPWIHAGDETNSKINASRGDGKFGVGGVVENLFSQWRAAKLQETLTAGLLGLALGQGDGTPSERGGHRDAASLRSRSQKVFDGSDVPRLVGDYITVMRKPRAESLEVINAKYLNGKQARRDAKRGVEEPGKSEK